jgi:hypothetical protein
MSISIAKYTFEGPYYSPSNLRATAGAYVILCERQPRSTILDVGQSENLRDRVTNHDRRGCWENHCQAADIRYAVYYLEDETGRRYIEQRVRKEYDVACGEV